MRRILSFAAVLSVVLPAVATAQSAAMTSEPTPAVVAPVASAPSVASPAAESPRSVTVAGQQALADARLAAGRGVPGMAPGKSFGQAEALMIVGGAAILGGILVGGNVGYVVSVVGLGVGLYGLYMYLR